jgi:hypothetical protein
MSVSDEEMLHQLDRLGPEQVRTMLARADIPEDWNVRSIVRWLAEKDFEAARSKSGDQRISTTTESLAEVVTRANKLSAWALVLAIFSLILSGSVLALFIIRQHGL